MTDTPLIFRGRDGRPIEVVLPLAAWVPDHVLLVTGSRSFGHLRPKDPKAQAARKLLVDRLAAWFKASPGRLLILSGGAIGPDGWSSAFAYRSRQKAIEAGQAARLDYLELLPNGQVRSTVEAFRWQWCLRGVHPFDRDLAEVLVTARWREMGAQVSALGLVDTLSQTFGTDHTLRLCKEHEIDVTREEA